MAKVIESLTHERDISKVIVTSVSLKYNQILKTDFVYPFVVLVEGVIAHLDFSACTAYIAVFVVANSVSLWITQLFFL